MRTETIDETRLKVVSNRDRTKAEWMATKMEATRMAAWSQLTIGTRMRSGREGEGVDEVRNDRGCAKSEVAGDDENYEIGSCGECCFRSGRRAEETARRSKHTDW